MIKLKLTNFQIHKKLTLRLDNVLTAIHGANDRGKSSIVRALYWLFYNSPGGDWMRRIDENGEATTAKVEVTFKDGTTISREKGKGVNRYVIDQEEVYEGFGHDVPQPVAEKLGVGVLTLNNVKVTPNVGMQDDRQFMIFESGATKAAFVNVLTGVDILEDAIKDFKKEAGQDARAIKEAGERINEVDLELSTLPDTEMAERLVAECDKMLKTIGENESELEKLGKIVAQCSDLEAKVKRADSSLEIFRDLENIEAELEETKRNETELNGLNAISKKYDTCKSKLDSISIVPDEEMKEVEEELYALTVLQIEYRKIDTMRKAYHETLEKVKQATTRLSEIDKAMKKFDGQKCYVCGNTINV